MTKHHKTNNALTAQFQGYTVKQALEVLKLPGKLKLGNCMAYGNYIRSKKLKLCYLIDQDTKNCYVTRVLDIVYSKHKVIA